VGPIDDTFSGSAQVVLVTGAGSGMGETIARLAADYNCAVACVDENFNAAARVARDLEPSAPGILSLGCDVRDAEAVRRMTANVIDAFGRVDVAVNATVAQSVAAFEEQSPAQWDDVLERNLRGAFLVAKAVFPLMKEQGSGHIVNVASSANGTKHAPAFDASMWGLLGFSRALDAEGRPHGIRVTTVISAAMRTRLLDRFTDGVMTVPDQALNGATDLLAREILVA